VKKIAILLVVLTGCFDSLVSDHCRSGLSWNGSECIPTGTDHDQPDAWQANGDGAGGEGIDAGVAVPPDAFVCTADTTSDPYNCGACGIVCASGICADSTCVGATSGHVVLIGHDYYTHNGASLRLLGDAIDLGIGTPLKVGIYQGSANASVAQRARGSIASAMSLVGRTYASTDLGAAPFDSLAGIGTVVVLPQRATDGGAALAASGASWAPQMKAFLARGGVIVVLEGEQDVSEQLLVGAGELVIGAKHADTGSALTVNAPADPCAVGVLSPYHADSTTVGWDGLVGDVAVVTDPTGGVVAVHGTR